MWDVWIEGYHAQGDRGYHEYVGSFSVDTFQDACILAALKLARWNWETFNRYYNMEQNTWWGCHFYDNEADATKGFG